MPGKIVAVYVDPNYGGDPFWIPLARVSAKILAGVYLEKGDDNKVYNIGQKANIKLSYIVHPLNNLKRLYILDLDFDNGYHVTTEVFDFLCSFCS